MKVMSVRFKSASQLAENSKSDVMDQEAIKKEMKYENVMEVYCTFAQEGLGPIKWWN